MECAAIQELIFYFLWLPNFPSATLAKDHGWRGDSVSSCAPLFVFSTNSELKPELSQAPLPSRSHNVLFSLYLFQFYSFEGQVLISFPFIVMIKVDFKMKLFIQNELLKEKY